MSNEITPALQDALQLPQAQPPRPGAAYLEARLRRASALPAAERSPEVAAFLETAQLCRKVCELLPLAHSASAGRADTGGALAASPQPRRQCSSAARGQLGSSRGDSGAAGCAACGH